MTKENEIKKLIEKSIKLLKEIEVNELRILLNKMSYEEIEMFWSRYSSSKSHFDATSKIVHWRTRDQEKYIVQDFGNYNFYPKKKGEKIKEDIMKHVIIKTKEIVQHEVQKELEFRKQPFLKRLPFYLFNLIFILIPVLVLFGILKWYLLLAVGCSIFLLIWILMILL